MTPSRVAAVMTEVTSPTEVHLFIGVSGVTRPTKAKLITRRL